VVSNVCNMLRVRQHEVMVVGMGMTMYGKEPQIVLLSFTRIWSTRFNNLKTKFRNFHLSTASLKTLAHCISHQRLFHIQREVLITIVGVHVCYSDDVSRAEKLLFADTLNSQLPDSDITKTLCSDDTFLLKSVNNLEKLQNFAMREIAEVFGWQTANNF